MNILIMMDLLVFEKENSEQIKGVENLFGPFSQPLFKPGRFLLGQGRLMKKGRTRWQVKSFFLFNDVFVYGSILPVGNWHKKQKIIALENIQVEDVEDSVDIKNQWLIRTPCKSFFVAASSIKEKKAWIEHIKDCQSNLLLDGSRQSGSSFAITWIPDEAAMKCMRCFKNFTLIKRRHHCRKCGFLVCNPCSKYRVLLDNISTQKCVRVCSKCYAQSKEYLNSHQTGDKQGYSSWEDEDRTTLQNNEKGTRDLDSRNLSGQLD